MAVSDNALKAASVRGFYLPTLSPAAGLRVVISSLSLGGAEKIVCEWLATASQHIKDIELAVLHRSDDAFSAPKGVKVLMPSKGVGSRRFAALVADRWEGFNGALSTHLVRDDVLQIFWDAGLKTAPVFHNAPEGWVNTPSSEWTGNTPFAIGCADCIAEDVKAAWGEPAVVSIRHTPKNRTSAMDANARELVRQEVGVDKDTLLIVMVGSLKTQKRYMHALEVLKEVRSKRKAHLMIVGGALNQQGEQEKSALLKKAEQWGIQKDFTITGFVDPMEKYLAASDVALNTSAYEGCSIATQECLQAGLPMVARAVNGQRELSHPALVLIDPDASIRAYVEPLLSVNVRDELKPALMPRLADLWSVPHGWVAPKHKAIDTLFVTANLNAGGAQRSLVNLSLEAKKRGARFAVSVCNGSTHNYFSSQMQGSGIVAFHPTRSENVTEISRQLMAWVSQRQVKQVVFWNTDPKIKLLMTKFALPDLKFVDVSPGAYATREIFDAKDFQAASGLSAEDYYCRLSNMIFKHGQDREGVPVDDSKCHVIPNGVDDMPRCFQPVPEKAERWLVSGRIAQSKHLDVIIGAFIKHQRSRRNAELHIYGQAERGCQEYLKNLKKLAEGVNITFAGDCPELTHLQRPWTAQIVLGTHQGCPNSVLEAMSAGIPVIANDSGGTREWVDESSPWLLPETPSVSLLVNAMREMVEMSQEEREQLASDNKSLVSSSASMSLMFSRYEPIIFPQCLSSQQDAA